MTLPEKKVSKYTTGLKIIGTELKPVSFAAPTSTLKPDRRGTLALDADAAELHGDGIKVEQHGGISESRLLGQFQRLGLVEGRLHQAGRLQGDGPMRNTRGESEIALEVAGKQLFGKVTATGDWGKFSDVALGTVEIANRGVQEVKVRPRDASSWKAVNLSVVKFTPEK